MGRLWARVSRGDGGRGEERPVEEHSPGAFLIVLYYWPWKN